MVPKKKKKVALVVAPAPLSQPLVKEDGNLVIRDGGMVFVPPVVAVAPVSEEVVSMPF